MPAMSRIALRFWQIDADPSQLIVLVSRPSWPKRPVVKAADGNANPSRANCGVPEYCRPARRAKMKFHIQAAVAAADIPLRNADYRRLFSGKEYRHAKCAAGSLLARRTVARRDLLGFARRANRQRLARTVCRSLDHPCLPG